MSQLERAFSLMRTTLTVDGRKRFLEILAGDAEWQPGTLWRQLTAQAIAHIPLTSVTESGGLVITEPTIIWKADLAAASILTKTGVLGVELDRIPIYVGGTSTHTLTLRRNLSSVDYDLVIPGADSVLCIWLEEKLEWLSIF